MIGSLIGILVIILGVAALIGLEGLIIWGIGSFVCWAFAIPFVFTFWHGCAIVLVLAILKGIFQRNNNLTKEE